MKKNKIESKKIKTIADIEKFFNYVIDDLQLGAGFHPDTPFKDYIVMATDKPTFTSAQAKRLDKRMAEAFKVASKQLPNKKYEDIYTIGLKKAQSFLHNPGKAVPMVADSDNEYMKTPDGKNIYYTYVRTPEVTKLEKWLNENKIDFKIKPVDNREGVFYFVFKSENELMQAEDKKEEFINQRDVVNDSGAYSALKKRNIFIDDKLKLYPPDKIELLRTLIHDHLETCEPAKTPTICQMKSEKNGYQKVENEIIERIIRNGLTVSDAIIQIESEFNPNMD